MSQSSNPHFLSPSQRHFSRFAMPIVKGVNRGMWWSIASGGKIARVLLGSYERQQTAVMEASLSQGDVFLDVGAHHGYFSLMAARKVGKIGKVLAFEPSPINTFFLKKHIRMNGLKHVRVLESAVGASNGTVHFAAGTGTGTGHIDSSGELKVRVARLDDELDRCELSPTHMKIDVEGAELDVLQGGRHTLMNHRPILFLSTHGAEVHDKCCQYLAALDYDLQPILGEDIESSSELLCQPKEKRRALAA